MKCRLNKRVIDGVECFEFIYAPTEDVVCVFSTLNECMDEVRAEMEEWAASKGLKWTVVEVNCRPWLVTILDSNECQFCQEHGSGSCYALGGPGCC